RAGVEPGHEAAAVAAAGDGDLVVCGGGSGTGVDDDGVPGVGAADVEGGETSRAEARVEEAGRGIAGQEAVRSRIHGVCVVDAAGDDNRPILADGHLPGGEGGGGGGDGSSSVGAIGGIELAGRVEAGQADGPVVDRVIARGLEDQDLVVSRGRGGT